ncbi:MAG: hypothetical protein AMXMBFR59_24070 [Rhodanobacteraceae bacterium]
MDHHEIDVGTAPERKAFHVRQRMVVHGEFGRHDRSLACVATAANAARASIRARSQLQVREVIR